MPLKFKLHNNNSKYILRELLKKYLPNDVVNRPKQGFGIPLGEWMKNEIKDWVCDSLSSETCSKHNFFNYNIVKNTLENHFKGLENNASKIWSILQFNQWYQAYVK